MMEIRIKITNEEARHLSSPHSFSDECGQACSILYKVQKQINKAFKGTEKSKISGISKRR